MLTNKLIIITGANRGIGYALAEKLILHQDRPRIILTSRNPNLGQEAYQLILSKHPKEENRVFYKQLDINSNQSILNFSHWISDVYKTFDILINNAGIGDTRDAMGVKNFTLSPEETKQTINTNFYSTVELTESLLPFLSKEGKIVSLTSILAKFTMQGENLKQFFSKENIKKEDLFNKLKEFEEKAVENQQVEAGFCKSVYNVSKVFLNAYTKFVLAPQMNAGQACFTVYPGWCKTNIGGEKAPLSTEKGAEVIVKLLELDKEVSKKNNGALFDDKGKFISY